MKYDPPRCIGFFENTEVAKSFYAMSVIIYAAPAEL